MRWAMRYGLAMVQLDNGDVIAVCTTEEVQKLGIEDGTVITKWDGKDILQACSENVPDLGMSVKANADRVAAIVLSGIGGETVDVTFVDKSGKEQTVTLTDNGLPHTQLEAFQAYEHFEKLGTPDEDQSLNSILLQIANYILNNDDFINILYIYKALL